MINPLEDEPGKMPGLFLYALGLAGWLAALRQTFRQPARNRHRRNCCGRAYKLMLSIRFLEIYKTPRRKTGHDRQRAEVIRGGWRGWWARRSHNRPGRGQWGGRAGSKHTTKQPPYNRPYRPTDHASPATAAGPEQSKQQPSTEHKGPTAGRASSGRKDGAARVTLSPSGFQPYRII